MKTQKLLTYLRKCISEYDLIRPNDKIAVGLSGGKDSFVLLYGLRKLQTFYPVPYTLEAITIDLGFGMDYTPAEKFCNLLDVPYHIEQTEIAAIVREKSPDNMCSLCANMRRGALTAAAENENCTVLALGHHKDDYLTTLMLSLIYEGRFYTFSPATEYKDRRISVIRPMLYVPESACSALAEDLNFPVIKNLCPEDKNTKREEMKALIKKLAKDYPDIREKLFHAVTASDIPDWVQARKRKEDPTIHG